MSDKQRVGSGLSRTKQRRISQLGDARRGLLVALGTAGILREQEGDFFRLIIDRIQDEAVSIAGEAARTLMDTDMT